MNSEIKEWADRIYESDKAKYQKLVVWIRAAQRNYSAEVLIATLKRFYRMCRHVDSHWWPYLDHILDKEAARRNARESEAEHASRKEAEAEYVRDAFGGREIRKEPRQDREKS